MSTVSMPLPDMVFVFESSANNLCMTYEPPASNVMLLFLITHAKTKPTMPNHEEENNISKEPFLPNQVVRRSDRNASGALFLLTDGNYFPETGQFGATVLLRQTDSGATGAYSIHWQMNAFEESSWDDLKAFEQTLKGSGRSN